MEIYSDISKISEIIDQYSDLIFVRSSDFSETNYNRRTQESCTLNGRRWTYLDHSELKEYTISVYFYKSGELGIKRSSRKLSKLVDAAKQNNLINYKKLYENATEDEKYISFQYAIFSESMTILEYIYSNNNIKNLFYNMYNHPQVYCVYNNSFAAFDYITAYDMVYDYQLLSTILNGDRLEFLKFLLHKHPLNKKIPIDGYAKFIINNPKRYPKSYDIVQYWLKHSDY